MQRKLSFTSALYLDIGEQEIVYVQNEAEKEVDDLNKWALFLIKPRKDKEPHSVH